MRKAYPLLRPENEIRLIPVSDGWIVKFPDHSDYDEFCSPGTAVETGAVLPAESEDSRNPFHADAKDQSTNVFLDFESVLAFLSTEYLKSKE